MHTFLVVMSVIGSIIVAILALHVIIFIAWWFMLPIMMFVSFIELFTGGPSRNEEFWSWKCPFMKLFRREEKR